MNYFTAKGGLLKYFYLYMILNEQRVDYKVMCVCVSLVHLLKQATALSSKKYAKFYGKIISFSLHRLCGCTSVTLLRMLTDLYCSSIYSTVLV